MASVFISYGHADCTDTNWVERLRLYLMQNRQDGGLEIWDDTKIEPGSNWRKSIEAALTAADAAILLVGPAFLASEFVRMEELPHLLSAQQQHGKPIFPLIVKHCSYRKSVLQTVQAFNDPDQPLEGLATSEQNRFLNKLAVTINEKVEAWPLLDRSRAAITSHIAAAKAMQKHLGDTRTAFVAQVRRRDELVRAIEKRTKTHNTLQFEQFFFKYYAGLEPEEHFIFDQIRALTEGPLYRGNRAIVDLLEAHPLLIEEIPRLVQLRQHLVFWLNRYDMVFVKRPEMCLLYCGVEDAVPFPNGVENDIENWITRQAAD
jgi:TIR domain